MILGSHSPAVALVCAVLCAAAAPPIAHGAASSKDEGAQQAFRAGVDAARQEHWAEARGLFEKAYALSPRPVVLINLAGAQARTGKLIDAARNYRSILDDESSPETSSFRKAAAEILPALEARIPRVRLRPSGLTPVDVIHIDDDPVELQAVGSGHPLDPGEHTLVVRHEGAERARVLFTLTERELRYITLPLPAMKQPRPAPALLATEGDEQVFPGGRDSATARPWWKSRLTWAAVGVVVAGVAVTTFFLIERTPGPFVGNISPGSIEVP
jgi:hypothetical protein